VTHETDITRTVQILREDAQGILDGCTIAGSNPPNWAGDTEMEALHDEYLALADRLDAITPLAELERAEIMRALAKFNGDKRQAAEALGISLKTIYNRLNHYAAQDALMGIERKAA
jgi:DNA-binding NtrC family response regulator